MSDLIFSYQFFVFFLELKEGGGAGRIVVTGIRTAESGRREPLAACGQLIVRDQFVVYVKMPQVVKNQSPLVVDFRLLPFQQWNGV